MWYIGPVVRMMEIIGQQQCVQEFRHTPMLCKGVICQKQELLCELLLAFDESEPKSDYVETKLNQVSGFLSPIFFGLVISSYHSFSVYMHVRIQLVSFIMLKNSFKINSKFRIKSPNIYY